MKYDDLKKKSQTDLIDKNRELRAELFQLRIKNKTAQLEKKSNIRVVRKDIARVQTKLSELRNGKSNEKK